MLRRCLHDAFERAPKNADRKSLNTGASSLLAWNWQRLVDEGKRLRDISGVCFVVLACYSSLQRGMHCPAPTGREYRVCLPPPSSFFPPSFPLSCNVLLLWDDVLLGMFCNMPAVLRGFVPVPHQSIKVCWRLNTSVRESKTHFLVHMC